MAQFIESTGDTVAQAIQKGLSELNVSISDVETKIITNPKSGFFGFGKSKARVLITIKEVSKEIENLEKAIKQEIKQTSAKPAKKIPTDSVLGRNSGEKVIKTELSNADIKAKTFVDGLLAQMKVDATCEVLEAKSKTVSLDIKGNGLGSVIGRRGETLDAIQYIATLACKDVENDEKFKIIIDCEDYRAKRLETLENVALKMGSKVLNNKKNMTLEPMNPFERRVIHEVLQNHRGIHTYSTGKEPNRRVVIGFGEGKDKK